MRRNFGKIIKDYGEFISSYPKTLRIPHNSSACSTEDVKSAEAKYLKQIFFDSKFNLLLPDHPVPQ